MKKYIGITIGPIIDTIMEASSPAALWFSSSVFSDLTRRLCKDIKNKLEAEIYSPYYDDNICSTDGIGKFHDRILFSVDDGDNVEDLKKSLDEIIAKAKIDTKNSFPENFIINDEFLKNYIQIHYVVLDEKHIKEKNCIDSLSKKLDVLELMKTFPSDNGENAFKKLFAGEKNAANTLIKESNLFKGIDDKNNQFFKNAKKMIRTIDEIASVNGSIKDDIKRKNYYAVVQADGDNMGEYLAQLDDNRVTYFSNACLEYDEKAAKMIGEFGGMTIYAGGDDLLFLAPVVNGEGTTIFELCNEINSEFESILKNHEKLDCLTNIPTISFGISIQYKKYPLYEALDKARDLLFIDAKANNGKAISGLKKKMAVHLQKHSGKSVKLLISNDSCNIFCKFLHAGKNKIETEKETEIIKSILYHLRNFEFVFKIANENVKDKDKYISVWKNMFDGDGQKSAWDYINEICTTFYINFIDGRKAKIETVNESGEPIKENEAIKTLIAILQFKKFLEEKRMKSNMKYLVKIKPLEPYAFGTERNFVYEGTKQAGKETYFIRSNTMPEQTTLLGMLRYIILDNNGFIQSDFGYDPETIDKISELIGEKSFSFATTDEQNFRRIERISPSFIIYEEGEEVDNFLINMPFHVKSDKNADKCDYKTIKMSEKQLETSEGRINIPEDGEYSAKAGHASGYFNITKKCRFIEKDDEPLFQSSIQTGNRKNGKSGNSDEDCFFKREVISMHKKCCFGIFAEINCEDKTFPKETITYMGQKKSAFRVTFTPASVEENYLENRIKESFDSDEEWYYAFSDIYIENSNFKYKNFSIVEEKQLRNLETEYSSSTRTDALKKSNVQYNLIKRGSVFYKDLPEWTIDKNKEKIGYNIIVKIGGRK